MTKLEILSIEGEKYAMLLVRTRRLVLSLLPKVKMAAYFLMDYNS